MMALALGTRSVISVPSLMMMIMFTLSGREALEGFIFGLDTRTVSLALLY